MIFIGIAAVAVLVVAFVWFDGSRDEMTAVGLGVFLAIMAGVVWMLVGGGK